MLRFQCGWGSGPDPAVKAYNAPSGPYICD